MNELTAGEKGSENNPSVKTEVITDISDCVCHNIIFLQITVEALSVFDSSGYQACFEMQTIIFIFTVITV